MSAKRLGKYFITCFVHFKQPVDRRNEILFSLKQANQLLFNEGVLMSTTSTSFVGVLDSNLSSYRYKTTISLLTLTPQYH